LAIAPSEAPGALIAERAYVELRDRIVTLRLPPGTVLREDDLMAELGIGRTPLREAVKRLALENLVAVRPRRGTYVTDVDAAEIIHITGSAPSSRATRPSSRRAGWTPQPAAPPSRWSSRSRGPAATTTTRA
jgi:DNA-binding FadR family transcriptional regulator